MQLCVNIPAVELVLVLLTVTTPLLRVLLTKTPPSQMPASSEVVLYGSGGFGLLLLLFVILGCNCYEDFFFSLPFIFILPVWMMPNILGLLCPQPDIVVGFENERGTGTVGRGSTMDVTAPDHVMGQRLWLALARCL